jgi:hypothetical protein
MMHGLRIEAGASVRALHLSVLLEHCATAAADPPAMGGERRTALHQVAPGHAARTVAEARSRRPAWCKRGKINRTGGRGGNAEEKACCYHCLHAEVVLIC